MGMMAKFEELTAQYLRLVLSGVRVGETILDSEPRRQLLSALELFLPLILREADSNYWRLEAFDGFQFPVARKTGACEAELRGAGLLLSDETWIPVQARLQVASNADTIAWGSCQAGDRRVGRSEQLSAKSPELRQLLQAVSECPEHMDWAFSAEYPAVSHARTAATDDPT
jgi:hypothetical protein